MTMNSEWHHMFTAMDNQSNTPPSPSGDSGTSPNSPQSVGMQIQQTPSSSLVEYSMPEKNSCQERISDCRRDMEFLTQKLKNRYATLAANRNYDPASYYSPIPINWKLNGNLVAHLHEHKSAVTKMTALRPFGSLFASASIDGTVRLWDCNKLDGNQSVNRSRQIYIANTPLYSIAACDSGQSLAVSGKDGTLMLLRIDPYSSKMALQQARQLDSSFKTNGDFDDGPVVDMQPMDQATQSVIIFATLYGAIVGWDIRMPEYAWRLESNLRDGVITTFCVDPTSSWLAVGTSSGKHIFWDLRFRLPISEIQHPTNARIRRIACHPTEPSWLFSASQGNNEVYALNIETKHRQAAYWTSQAPPLTNVNVSKHSVCALLPGVVDRSGFILTGGTDQRIRYWDFGNPKNCSLVVPAPKDPLLQSEISYE